jgi:4-amino-4-deoxy-L-arabinose transferase-like glycosyltransferase
MAATRTEIEPDEPGAENRASASMETPVRRFLEWMARYWYIILPAIFLAVALPALGARPYRFEEGRRVAQVLAFLDGRSWLRLEIFGEAYANKPPLLPWLIALAAKAFGQIDEFAARLPGAMAVGASALTAAFMASRATERRPYLAALAAGIFIMAAPVVFQRIRLAETDSMATACVSAAFLVWAMARLRHDGEVGFLSWCGVTFFLGAALLTKGPPPVLFALVPMVVIPLQERRWRQLAALALALVVSSLPLAYWLFANIDLATAAHLSGEMRLQPAFLPGFRSYFRELPETLASGLLQFFPCVIFGVIWMGEKSSWRKGSNWVDHALFLFAVPASVALLFWPSSEARYIMPAVWPISVMAGLLFARHWDRRSAPILLGATLLMFVVVQAIYVVREGRTPGQAAERQMADALAAAVAPLPEGRIVIWGDQEKPNYNLYVYMRRNATLVTGATLACVPDSSYLLADDNRARLIDPKTWSKLTAIEGADMTLYQRRAGAMGC